MRETLFSKHSKHIKISKWYYKGYNMDLEKLQKEVEASFSHRFKSTDTRVSHSIKELSDINTMSLDAIKTVATTILDAETQSQYAQLQKLQEQREQLDRQIEKQSETLQDAKYSVFNALENEFAQSPDALSKLHQVKLQSIDLFNILSDMVESVIITALEKDSDGHIQETTSEAVKEITYEAIKEGSLNTIRIRKILSTILQAAIEVAEATPNRADEILSSTLKGMRSGLLKAIDRFKQRLAFMPVEAKHILIEDYDTIIEDLNQTDTLFSQVVITQASQSSQNTRVILLDLNKGMKYDLEELVHLSKETAEVMRDKFSAFAKKAAITAEGALKSQKAQEAKRMGIQALDVAKNALGSAIKSAKDVMESKEK